MSEEGENQQDNIDQQFQQFLKDNKIDTSALEGTKDKQKLLNPKEQRNLSILKTVCCLYCSLL